jgi:hypothetical protein
VTNTCERSTASRRAWISAGALALGVCAACETPGPTSRERNERVNMELFEQLIQGGTMRPVDDYEEDTAGRARERGYARDLGGSEQRPDVPREVDTEDPPINPYMEFGSQVYVYKDTGLVMKPYSFPTGIGRKAFDLLSTYGDFPIHGAGINGEGLPEPGSVQPLNSVVLDLREGWSTEAWSDPRGAEKGILSAPENIILGDLLIVTASPEVMFDVQHFISIFLEDVKQIEIEAKIVEVATSDSLDYGIRRIDDSTPIFALPNPGGLVRSVDFSFSNTVDSTEALFGVGAVFDGVKFNAILEAVASSENVSIISRPKVAVREGARADIINIKAVPFFNISAIAANGNFTTTLVFKDVGVQMYIIPRVIGENTVSLTIDIEASQQTGTAVTFAQSGGADAAVIAVPEISTRKARTIVRLEPGQAVILGGLISERTLEREKKLPFLGDVPFLGNLFKNRFTVTEQTNVLFFIRPRILQGGDLNTDFGQ